MELKAEQLLPLHKRVSVVKERVPCETEEY